MHVDLQSMPRLAGSITGLLIFGTMLMRGVMAGSSVSLVLSRGIVGLFVGMGLGGLAGWVAQRVVQEHIAGLPRPPATGADAAAAPGAADSQSVGPS